MYLCIQGDPKKCIIRILISNLFYMSDFTLENKNRTSRTDLRSESLWYIFFGSPCSIISQVAAVQVGLADELWEGTLQVSALLVDFFHIGPLVHPTCRRQLRRNLGWRRRGLIWSPEGAGAAHCPIALCPLLYLFKLYLALAIWNPQSRAIIGYPISSQVVPTQWLFAVFPVIYMSLAHLMLQQRYLPWYVSPVSFILIYLYICDKK